MSFILDALKKSEAERQRQAGPTLLELRITRPPRRYPPWSLIVGALLAVNVAVLLTFLLRRPPAVTAAGAAASAQVASQVQVQAAPARAAPPAHVVIAVPASTAAPAAVASPAVPPTPAGVGGTAAAPAGDAADADAVVPTHNPADDEPALPPGTRQAGPAPAPTQQAAAAQPAGAADYSNLPSLSQISGNIPAMRLDLLDYSQLASERYALINMRRVREGDVLPDGARVLAITPNGVAVDYRGQQFLLRPGGTAQ